MKSKRLDKFYDLAGFFVFSSFLLVGCGKEEALGLDTKEMVEAMYKKIMWNQEHKAASPEHKKELQEGIVALQSEIDTLKGKLYETKIFKHFLVYLGVMNKYVQNTNDQSVFSAVQEIIDERIEKIKNNPKFGENYKTSLVMNFNDIAIHPQVIAVFHSKASDELDKDKREEYDKYFKENARPGDSLRYFGQEKDGVFEGKTFNDDTLAHGKLIFKEFEEARDLYCEIVSASIEVGKKKRFLASIPDAK